MIRVTPKTKKSVVEEFRREVILDAACRAFARSGYQNTPVEAIAVEAGIAKGTVYLYFKTKEDIYLAAIMHDLHRLHAESERRLAAASTCREKIEAFIRTRLDYVETHRDFYRIYVSEFGNAIAHPAAIQKQLRKMYRKQADLLESAIEGGIASGELRPMPARSAAFAIYDLARGFVEKRLLGWTAGQPEADAAFLADLLWNGMRNEAR